MAFLKYTLVRFGIMAAVFVVALLLGLGAIASAIVAVIVSFCVSYLFLTKMRVAASKSVETRISGNAKPMRTASEIDDAQAEDALIDANPRIGIDSDQRHRDTTDEAQGT